MNVYSIMGDYRLFVRLLLTHVVDDYNSNKQSFIGEICELGKHLPMTLYF